MDRERLADIAWAMRDIAAFERLYDAGARAIIEVSDERARVGIAARMTALPPMEVDIVYRSNRSYGVVVHVSPAELDAARLRDEQRRADWSSYTLDIDALHPTRRTTPFVIVSVDARKHGDAIRAVAGAPVRTYGTARVDRVEELVVMYGLKPAFVLDEDLEGTKALSARLHFPVRWISSLRGTTPEDIDEILASARVPSRRALGIARVFAGLRVLVVDLHDGSLDREIQHAAPGARIERAIGWDALERISEGDLDVVIAGNPRDISLPTLVRLVQRCASTPMLLVATDSMTTSRMRTAYPKLAHYFIERPVCAEDLLRVLRR